MEAHTKEWYENYAKENNLELTKWADKVIENVNKSEGYCPCKYKMWLKEKPEQIEEIKCPCKNSPNELNETGYCHCRLFQVKK